MPPCGQSKQPRIGKSVRAGETLQTVFEVSSQAPIAPTVTPTAPTAPTASNATTIPDRPSKATKAPGNGKKSRKGNSNTVIALSELQPLPTIQETLLNTTNLDDDPFCSNTESSGGTRFMNSQFPDPLVPSDLHTDESETLDINVSPTTSDDEEPLPVLPRCPSTVEKRPTNQQRRLNSRSRSPRSGPHSKPSSSSSQCQNTSPTRTSTVPKTSGPAGNRNHHEARDVWMFFRDSEESGASKGKGKAHRTCIFCEKLKSVTPTTKVKVYSSTTSTSTLRKHLSENHFEDWVDGCDEKNIPINEALNVYPQVLQHRTERDGQQQTPNTQRQGIPERAEFSKEAFVDAICDFVISDDQSINVIENPQLRAIFLMLRSELQDKDIPHRTVLRHRILERLDEYLKKLAKDMESSLGKISFTMDMWSDGNLTPFMGVTAHWIQAILVSSPHGSYYKLEMRADLIGFQRVPGRHTGEHLCTAFLAIIDRLKITSKIGWVTMDNATNNDKFCSVLERELRLRKISFDKTNNRVRCFPHIVNLACKAVLSAITCTQLAEANAPDFEPANDNQHVINILDALQRDPVASIRSAVRNIRSSSLRRQHFSEILRSIPNQEDRQLIKDVDTRWSSTLLMIMRALELKEPMIRFLSENTDLAKYQLSDMEWEALETVKDILLVPHAFQQLLSFEKIPTLGHTIPAFQSMIIAWKNLQAKCPEVEHIIQAGLDKLEGYQERLNLVPANILATLLHPLYRLRFFQKKMADDVEDIQQMFLDELRPYFNQETLAAGNTQKTDSSWASKILEFDSPVKASRGSSLEEEINSYFADRCLVPIDSVQFWQENQDRWPTLFKLALDILPIQGSAVPCERIFSSAKETTTARRNRIKPALMEALQILKFAIKNGHMLDFTKGTSQKEEILEMELEGTDSSSVPESLGSYRVHLQKLMEEEEAIEDEELFPLGEEGNEL